MKTLSLILLLSFGASAHVPQMNFNASSDNAMVCNDTDAEQPNHDPKSANYGRTEFLVLYHAIGCAGTKNSQTEICNSQVLQAGQCSSYHFKWGTTRRGAEVCVPKGHGEAKDEWNCGAKKGALHLSFYLNNGELADISHLSYVFTHYKYTDSNGFSVRGDVNVHKQ